MHDSGGNEARIVKGSPAAIAAQAPLTAQAAADLEALTAAGYRTLAVACGPPDRLSMVGLIAFGDPPRPTREPSRTSCDRSAWVPSWSPAMPRPPRRRSRGRSGWRARFAPPGKIPDSVGPDDFAVYAGVFPEDKFRLVKAFQQRGHAVGMCGDGANDAPALRQAQMGIAVSTATDVAKAAAGIVLTSPGLGGIVAAITEGRSGFQRILTYTLSLLVNKSATLVVMLAGLIMTGHAVLTPMLQALSMLAGDLVTMSRAADRATPSPYPNEWRVGNMTLAAIPLAIFKLCYYVGALATGWFVLGLDPAGMRTLTLLILVLGGQATTYVLRTRRYLWQSRPAPVMLCATLADVTIVTSLALGGVLMTPLAPAVVALLFGATLAFAFVLDGVKRIVFARVRID